MLIVDASVAVKWMLDEAGDLEARAIIERRVPLIAPELIVAEVTNVAWKRHVKGDISLRQARLIAVEVPRVFAQLFALRPLRSRALAIALELRHVVYDCFYLALAEQRDATIVTADRRLVARLAGSRWESRCRPLVA
jgi:predicted nucleic acid-binding protein